VKGRNCNSGRFATGWSFIQGKAPDGMTSTATTFRLGRPQGRADDKAVYAAEATMRKEWKVWSPRPSTSDVDRLADRRAARCFSQKSSAIAPKATAKKT